MKRTLLTLALLAALPVARAEGDTLTIAVNADPPTLDATVANQGITYRATSQIYEGLVFRDPQTNALVPRLATSWKQLSPTAWRFTLRKGVKFSDGTPLNAAAVKFSLDRFVDPATRAANAFILSALRDVRVVNDATVDLNLKYPYAPLLGNLAIFNPVIVSPTAVQKLGTDFARTPVGTGPYKLDRWDPGNQIVLVANPLYWGPKPRIRRIVIRTIPDEVTQIAELKSGRVDLLASVTPNVLTEFAKDPNFVVRRRTSFATAYLGFNTASGITKDVRVRQAIARAVDRNAIVKTLLGDLGARGEAPIPDIVFGASKTVKGIAFDPTDARKRLAEAGVKLGSTLTLVATNDASSRRLAQAVQFNLAAVGLTVNIQTSDFAAYRSALQKPDHAELFLMTDGPTSLDADFAFTQYFDSKEIPVNNYAFYKNAKVDGWLARARTEQNAFRRKTLYRQVQDQLQTDLPLLTLYYPVSAYVKSNRLQGEVPYWHASYIDYRRATLK
ncbi:ABC transporter substrate-binding protein [Deinococcus hopiensis]|uniref:Peptide/nickel transport system substrate-binding protein n=1 Tax=Deinococcus hopiensis KR-140 TaxID=695939 RepID=A0A1W1UQD7_9DEIO|nr:ABC transporter substrate-binding protein [Deinococcus hopiensis]SMB83280.1 peptide/nickel transport system substrate-binding protein [Deinococcus hopiensis KR-140]